MTAISIAQEDTERRRDAAIESVCWALRRQVDAPRSLRFAVKNPSDP
jgi:hypothetical protein